MKKLRKAIVSIAAFLSVSILAVGFGSCKNGKADNSAGESVWTMETVYAKAQELGFEGTLEEFRASLKGERGEDGKDGETPVITIGSDACWYIDGKNTGVKAEGQDGETPIVTIGKDGYWYIDGKSTGVKAQGEKGDDGKDGAKGETGAKGEDGIGIKDIYINANGELIVELTEGEPKNLGIVLDTHTHEWVNVAVIKEATCQEGVLLELCSVCGEEKYTLQEPLYPQHIYENGICILCEDLQTKGLEFTLNLQGGYYEVEGIGSCTDSRIYIPQKYQGLPVKSIGINAFRNCTDITSVFLPDGMERIRTYAFYGCTGISYISVPLSMKRMTAAFYGTNPMTMDYEGDLEDWLKMPGGLIYGSMHLYFNGVPADEIVIPDTIEWLNHSALSGIANLTSVIIPASVTYVAPRALMGCINLTKVVLPENLDRISPSLFQDCVSLTEISIPQSVIKIESLAFSGCTNLKDLILPSRLSFIGMWAFEKCATLTELKIPATVTEIEDYAFKDCDNITINCEAGQQPETWESDWNISNCPVVWGYKNES